MVPSMAPHQLAPTERPGHFAAEASTLGFQGGRWPIQIQLTGQGLEPVQFYLDWHTSTLDWRPSTDELKVYTSLTSTPTIDVLND